MSSWHGAQLTWGVGNLEWGGDGEGEVSLKATWGQGGQDRITPKEVFQVINKPCVREARYMRLISWTLQSGSEQFIYNWKTG
jgi:hypothetical protein